METFFLNSAYKVTLIIDLGHIIRWVSEAVPYAQHDIKRLRESLPEILPHLDTSDVLILDKGYQGINNHVNIGTWHVKKKKPKDGQLPKEDVEYNQDLEKVRRHIEFTIGSLKARFDTLAKTWRNDRRWITIVVRFCEAVHNNIILYNRHLVRYDSSYKGPIPKPVNEKGKKRKVKLNMLFRNFSQYKSQILYFSDFEFSLKSTSFLHFDEQFKITSFLISVG
jgi:hypothetical protein